MSFLVVRVVTCFGFGSVLLACACSRSPTEPVKEATPPAASPSSTDQARPAPTLAAPPSTGASVPVAVADAASPAPSASAGPSPGARVKHPIGGMDGCLEMYSACDANGRCTSAPFHLECGREGRVPGGDLLRCECP